MEGLFYSHQNRQAVMHQLRSTPMPLIFQISMLLLVCLSSVILACAEEFFLAGLTVPIAVAAWWFVDRLKLFSLPFWLPPIFAMLAFWAAIDEWHRFQQQSLLGVGGHLLTYLTWIYLLTEKNNRQYWWLIALCLLQVSVASLLTYSIWYGVGLFVWGLLATWTLTVFLLYRSTTSIDRAPIDVHSKERVVSGKSTSIGRIWNGVSRDPSNRLLTTRFVGNIFFVFVHTVLIATLFFLLIPRVWATANPFTGLSRTNKSVSGFSNQIRLGDLGEILEDDNEVMTVSLFHSANDKAFTLSEMTKFLGPDPLFRGAVLEDYREGRWSQNKSSDGAFMGAYSPKFQGPVRVHFNLRPIDTDILFSFRNLISARAEERGELLRRGVFTDELRRGSGQNQKNQSYQYYEYTDSAPSDTWNRKWRESQFDIHELGEVENERTPTVTESDFAQQLQMLTRVPRGCAELVPMAAKVVGNATTPKVVAQRIEDWFTSSGEFGYTTKLSASNSSIDPIVDFLKNRKTGHCEYFASSMAILLRTQGIPSRVITGFKGGVWSKRLNSLVVQQLHAHAWVEAFIDDGWVIFDPTPSARNEVVRGTQHLPSEIGLFWLGAETTWSRMTNLSQETQQTRIYGPLVRFGVAARDSVSNFIKSSKTVYNRIRDIVMYPDRWFSWEGGLLAAVTMLLLTAIVSIFRSLSRYYARLRGLADSELSNQAKMIRLVPFYERLVSILRNYGLEQTPTQTGREFVDFAKVKLAPRLVHAQSNPWPEVLVDAFYQVRFGGKELPPVDLQKLDQKLSELEECLTAKQVNES